MPLTPDPSPDFAKQIADLQSQLAALSKQQNVIITNAAGQKMIVLGLQSDGTYGLRSYDSAGRLRVVVGQLPSGDYGLSLSDVIGHTQALLPSVLSATAAGFLLTSPVGPVNEGASSPTVTAAIGASGDCIIDVGMTIGNAGACSGYATLMVDGVEVTGLGGVLIGGGTTLSVAVSKRFKYSSWTGSTLAPGSHTFGMLYYCSGGTGNANFTDIAIGVTPI